MKPKSSSCSFKAIERRRGWFVYTHLFLLLIFFDLACINFLHPNSIIWPHSLSSSFKAIERRRGWFVYTRLFYCYFFDLACINFLHPNRIIWPHSSSSSFKAIERRKCWFVYTSFSWCLILQMLLFGAQIDKVYLIVWLIEYESLFLSSSFKAIERRRGWFVYTRLFVLARKRMRRRTGALK